MKEVGPIKIIGSNINEELMVALATYESPLFPSVNRGARVTRKAGGINVVLVDDRMTRSVIIEAVNATEAAKHVTLIKQRTQEIAQLIAANSRFARFLELNTQIVGNLIYLRLAIDSGDAAGHNMVTKAADCVLDWLLKEYPQLNYVSISGNFCSDKKVSAVNGILGRGKYVIADVVISSELCQTYLHTTPAKIANLNIKKNLIGSNIAGSLRSANAHFANILLAIYLATGQDAANIIEGSQGLVHAEVNNDSLYFSVTLPNIIVGTIGSGKNFDFVKDNLTKMGCLESRATGENAQRLAMIIAAAVLCGELSLLAAQTNRGELVRSHLELER